MLPRSAHHHRRPRRRQSCQRHDITCGGRDAPHRVEVPIGEVQVGPRSVRYDPLRRLKDRPRPDAVPRPETLAAPAIVVTLPVARCFSSPSLSPHRAHTGMSRRPSTIRTGEPRIVTDTIDGR